jgi:hypothetical protein
VGRKNGDPIGTTGRYVEARKDDPGLRFYLASSLQQPYWEWGDHMPRVTLFAKDPSQVGAVDPVSLRDFSAPAPFTLLMRREIWQGAATELADRYPRGRIQNITPDGARVALEVPAS